MCWSFYAVAPTCAAPVVHRCCFHNVVVFSGLFASAGAHKPPGAGQAAESGACRLERHVSSLHPLGPLAGKMMGRATEANSRREVPWPQRRTEVAAKYSFSSPYQRGVAAVLSSRGRPPRRGTLHAAPSRSFSRHVGDAERLCSARAWRHTWRFSSDWREFLLKVWIFRNVTVAAQKNSIAV